MKFTTLQAGRGIAVCTVCAFHLSILLGEERYLGRQVFRNLTWRGDLGVDFFFVLSGFIIVAAHAKDIGVTSKWSEFLRRRFVRIYPVYLFYTAAFCSLMALGVGTVARTPGDAYAWISTLSLIRLTNFQTPLAQAWTLFHEVAFYFLFSILILNRRVGAVVLAMWFGISAVLLSYAPEFERTPLNTYVSGYNLDFLLGICAYFVWTLKKQLYSTTAFILGAILLAGNLVAQYSGHSLNVQPLLYAIGFSGLLAGLTHWEWKRERITIPLLPLIGNASYSIYLTHVAFLGLFSKLFLRIPMRWQIPDAILYIAVFVLTIYCGCLSYKFIEQPLTESARRWLYGKRPALR